MREWSRIERDTSYTRQGYPDDPDQGVFAQCRTLSRNPPPNFRLRSTKQNLQRRDAYQHIQNRTNVVDQYDPALHSQIDYPTLETDAGAAVGRQQGYLDRKWAP
jgi:hypothetical protein